MSDNKGCIILFHWNNVYFTKYISINMKYMKTEISIEIIKKETIIVFNVMFLNQVHYKIENNSKREIYIRLFIIIIEIK